MLIDNDPYQQDKYSKAAEFWANASAYAVQAAPYGVERLSELDQMAGEIQQGMQFMPPQQQEHIRMKLKQLLLDPVENSTAQEFDSAWAKLQQITRDLHERVTPKMSQMNGLAGPMNPDPMMDEMPNEDMPTGPHMMPDGTMMGAY
jgi:hypothetical protein